MSGRAWWIGIAVSMVVGACGGDRAVIDNAPLTTESSPVIAIAGDPDAATTSIPTVAAAIRIGAWDGQEIDFVCLESIETYTEWITVLEQDQPQLPSHRRPVGRPPLMGFARKRATRRA